jgi:hypothetical protein
MKDSPSASSAPLRFFDIPIIAQKGLLSFETMLFSLSLHQTNHNFGSELFVVTP